MNMRKLTMIIGVIILGIDAIFWSRACDIVAPADVYPKALIILIAIMAIAVMMKAWFFPNKEKAAIKPFESVTFSRVLVSILAVALYLLGMQFIGFYVSTFVFMVVLIIVLEHLQEEPTPLTKRNLLMYVAISLGTTLTVYIAFSLFLSVPTPEGLLI